MRLRRRFRGTPSREGGTKAQYQARLDWCNDARTGMPLGIPRGAMCVQRFDDSLNSAIHITYRISLRSSSMPEPRDPLLKVLIDLSIYSDDMVKTRVWFDSGGSSTVRGPAALSPPSEEMGVPGRSRQSNKGFSTTKGWRSGPKTLTH
jgi:hypothetical protein